MFFDLLEDLCEFFSSDARALWPLWLGSTSGNLNDESSSRLLLLSWHRLAILIVGRKVELTALAVLANSAFAVTVEALHIGALL